MNRSIGRFVVTAAVFSFICVANAAELSLETWHGWEQYVKTADSRMRLRLAKENHFMWMDEDPNRRLKAGQGEIVTAPFQGSLTPVYNGLIHDWIGAAFLPNVTLKQFFGVVQDYGNYKRIYGPNVVESQVLDREEIGDRFSMLLARKTGLFSVALSTTYQSQTFQVNENEYYTISQSTSIRQVRNYGKANQEELPEGQGDGFIWSLHSIMRYEQRDGGVYVELEAIALSRDIPASVRWLVKPLAAKLSRDSIETTLRQTRDALSECDKPLSARLGKCASHGEIENLTHVGAVYTFVANH